MFEKLWKNFFNGSTLTAAGARGIMFLGHPIFVNRIPIESLEGISSDLGQGCQVRVTKPAQNQPNSEIKPAQKLAQYQNPKNRTHWF